MKKAQTEIIGLAIIVILVILGMTFVIKFLMDKPPVETKKEFTQAELASNMLDAFLETTARENNCKFTMSQLLQNCGQGGGITCNNKDSCEYARDAVNEIFEEKTLGKVWNIPYEFKVFYSNDENDNLFQPIGKACAGNKKSKSYIIPTTKGPLTVKLDICS